MLPAELKHDLKVRWQYFESDGCDVLMLEKVHICKKYTIKYSGWQRVRSALTLKQPRKKVLCTVLTTFFFEIVSKQMHLIKTDNL